MSPPALFVGLMSGTSLDGVDAVLASIVGSEEGGASWEVLGFHSRPYETTERDAIRVVIDGGSVFEVAQLSIALADWHAEAVRALLKTAAVDATDVRAVGFHGQTVMHHPPGASERGATLQLGDAATLAEHVGIDIVHDFRSRDVAAGGHGAPLVAWPDAQLFSHAGRRRVLQNLGGMGNVTWLPARAEQEAPFAFDTGPGVALIDRAVVLGTGGEASFDEGGRLAESGTVDSELLGRLLAMPFFLQEPPRTTGRETFGDALVAELSNGLTQGRAEGWTDLIATLVAFTAESIADSYRRWVLARGIDEAFLMGGGAHNPALVRAIREALPEVEWEPGESLGLDPSAREALCFATLAWGFLEEGATNVQGSTGATGPRRLGSLTPAR